MKFKFDFFFVDSMCLETICTCDKTNLDEMEAFFYSTLDRIDNEQHLACIHHKSRFNHLHQSHHNCSISSLNCLNHHHFNQCCQHNYQESILFVISGIFHHYKCNIWHFYGNLDNLRFQPSSPKDNPCRRNVYMVILLFIEHYPYKSNTLVLIKVIFLI